MKAIDHHHVPGLMEPIVVAAVGLPDPDGLHSRYEVSYVYRPPLFISGFLPSTPITHQTTIQFQEGPVGITGINGLSGECLLAILLDRYIFHQAGRFPCDENIETVDHIRGALNAQTRRTVDRVFRGVEGQDKP